MENQLGDLLSNSKWKGTNEDIIIQLKENDLLITKKDGTIGKCLERICLK
jgi:hypothetical protein